MSMVRSGRHFGSGVLIILWLLLAGPARVCPAAATTQPDRDAATPPKAKTVEKARNQADKAAIQARKAREYAEALDAKAQANLEKWPPYRKAKTRLDEAKLQHDLAAAPVLQALAATPAYKAQLMTVQASRDRVAVLRLKPGVSEDQLRAAAVERMNAEAALAKLEYNAIEDDAVARTSRTRYLEAQQEVAAVRQQYIDQLPTHQKVRNADAAVAASQKQVQRAQEDLMAQQQRQAQLELEKQRREEAKKARKHK